MVLPFDIEKDDLLILLRNYEERRQAKQAEVEISRAALEKGEHELAVLEEKVNRIRKQLDPIPAESKASFPTNGTWNDRIKFVLDLFGRALSTSEIVTVLEEYMKDWDRKRLMTSVSATISAAINTIYIRDGDKISLK